MIERMAVFGGRRERWGLHLALFVSTLFTTTLSGALFAGRDPLSFEVFTLRGSEMFLPTGIILPELLPGLWFSAPLLAILLAHELGHYLMALRRGLDASPPFFIPAPFFLNLIGTFGAFIRLRSPLLDRAVLLDVGAAGPLASFALSIPLAVWGLRRSSVAPVAFTPPTPYAVPLGGEGVWWVGDSLAFGALARLFGPEGSVVILDPLALAAWLGLFVTALNLFPLYQLDGGHVAYALIGRGQRWVGALFLVILLLLGSSWWGGWWGWWLWAAIILLLGRGSVAHPPVVDPERPLTPLRRAAGWACLVILVLTFTPVPFSL